MSSRQRRSINVDKAGIRAESPVEASRPGVSSAPDATVLVLAWGASDEDLVSQLSDMAEWRRSRPNVRPVFVTDNSTVEDVASHGFDVEPIDGDSGLTHRADASTPDASGSLNVRLQEIVDDYRPHLVVAAGTASLRSAISTGALDAILSASHFRSVKTTDDYEREVERLDAARKLEKRKKRRAPEDAARMAEKLVRLEEKLNAMERDGLLPISGMAPLDVNEGRQFLGPLNEGCATTLVLAWGLTKDALERLLHEIGCAQTMLRDFKPLFVTDSRHVDVLRRSGYSFELVPSFTVWSRSNPSHKWVEFITSRMDRILRDYRPNRVVTFDGTQSFDALRRGVMNRLLGGGPRLEHGAVRPPRDQSEPSRGEARATEVSRPPDASEDPDPTRGS